MRLLSASVLFALAASAVYAQPPAAVRPAPVRWEYAELSFRTVGGRPAGKDADGNEVPAAPDTVSIRWTTGAEEMSVKGWDEFADQLKNPIRKGSTPAGQRIQALNALGAAGWELVESQTTPTTPTVVSGGFGGKGGGGGIAPFGGGPLGELKGGFAQFGGGSIRGATGGTMLFKRRVQ